MPTVVLEYNDDKSSVFILLKKGDTMKNKPELKKYKKSFSKIKMIEKNLRQKIPIAETKNGYIRELFYIYSEDREAFLYILNFIPNKDNIFLIEKNNVKIKSFKSKFHNKFHEKFPKAGELSTKNGKFHYIAPCQIKGLAMAMFLYPEYRWKAINMHNISRCFPEL